MIFACRQVRLSAEDHAALVARYEAGEFKKELARIYGVHVETARAIIARQGGDPRRAGTSRYKET